MHCNRSNDGNGDNCVFMNLPYLDVCLDKVSPSNPKSNGRFHPIGLGCGCGCHHCHMFNRLEQAGSPDK